MAGNPNWKKGAVSPNPEGRKKTRHSVRTPKGMIENFIKRNLSQRQLQRMFDELDSKDQFKVLTEMLPYIMPKQSSLTADINFDNLNDRDLDALYYKVTQNLTLDITPYIELESETVKMLDNNKGN
jgi:hypothetical protein